MTEDLSLFSALKEKFDEKVIIARQVTADSILTIWVSRDNLHRSFKVSEKRYQQTFQNAL